MSAPFKHSEARRIAQRDAPQLIQPTHKALLTGGDSQRHSQLIFVSGAGDGVLGLAGTVTWLQGLVTTPTKKAGPTIRAAAMNNVVETGPLLM